MEASNPRSAFRFDVAAEPVVPHHPLRAEAPPFYVNASRAPEHTESFRVSIDNGRDAASLFPASPFDSDVGPVLDETRMLVGRWCDRQNVISLWKQKTRLDAIFDQGKAGLVSLGLGNHPAVGQHIVQCDRRSRWLRGPARCAVLTPVPPHVHPHPFAAARSTTRSAMPRTPKTVAVPRKASAAARGTSFWRSMGRCPCFPRTHMQRARCSWTSGGAPGHSHRCGAVLAHILVDLREGGLVSAAKLGALADAVGGGAAPRPRVRGEPSAGRLPEERGVVLRAA